jgi:membrane protease YdiL (CAAX protease family)
MHLLTPETNNNNSKGVSWFRGCLIVIGLAMLGFVFSGVLGALLLKGDVSALDKPENAGLIRLIQVISVVLSMLIPALVSASFINWKPFELLGFKTRVHLNQVGLVLLIAILAIIAAGALGGVNKAIPVSESMKTQFEKLESSYIDQVMIMLDFKSTGGYILSILIMAFLPALCEEAIFRGALQNYFTRATKMPWVSIILVSFLFSIVHFSFYGFIPRMFLGIVLGLIFHLTQNLWLSVLAHFFNNALAVTSAYVWTKQGKSMKDAVNDDMSIAWWGLIFIPVIYFLFRSLQKNSRLQEINQNS